MPQMCKCTAVLCLFFFYLQAAQWCRFSSSITICLHTFLRGFSLKELKYYTKKLLSQCSSKRISNQLKVVSTFQQQQHQPKASLSYLRYVQPTSTVLSNFLSKDCVQYQLGRSTYVQNHNLIYCGQQQGDGTFSDLVVGQNLKWLLSKQHRHIKVKSVVTR